MNTLLDIETENRYIFTLLSQSAIVYIVHYYLFNVQYATAMAMVGGIVGIRNFQSE